MFKLVNRRLFLVCVGISLLLCLLSAAVVFAAEPENNDGQQPNEVVIETRYGTITAWSEGGLPPFVGFYFDDQTIKQIKKGELPTAFEVVDLTDEETKHLIDYLVAVGEELEVLTKQGMQTKCNQCDSIQGESTRAVCQSKSFGPLGSPQWISGYQSVRHPTSGYYTFGNNGGWYNSLHLAAPTQYRSLYHAVIAWKNGYPPYCAGWVIDPEHANLYQTIRFPQGANSYCTLTNTTSYGAYIWGGFTPLSPCSS